MADTKISALSSASALAGTEVLPVVQGGATVKTAVTTLLKGAGAGTAAAPAFSWAGDTNTGIYSDTADTIQFSTGGTLRMSIGATGIIGQVYTSDLATGANAAGSGALGDNTTAVGYQAGKDCPNTGDQLTAFGYQAAQTLVTPGTHNTMLGYQAGYTATNHAQSTLVGGLAGYDSDLSGSSSLTAVGYAAGYDSSGLSGTFVGFNAGNGSTGNQNTALGHATLDAGSSGADNTAVGYAALTANTSGEGNTAVGVSALAANTTAINSTAIGKNALILATGTTNTAVGMVSGYQVTTGTYNVAMGAGALYDLTEGSNNAAIGYLTGRGITTGSGNTILGANVTGLAAGLTDTAIIATGGVPRLTMDATGTGFNGAAVSAKPTITGSRGGNAALADLLTKLATIGLLTDSTS